MELNKCKGKMSHKSVDEGQVHVSQKLKPLQLVQAAPVSAHPSPLPHQGHCTQWRGSAWVTGWEHAVASRQGA